MPCYNAALFVQDAVDSVLQQEYSGAVQFIVVDDASTDGSYDVVQQIFSEYRGNMELVLMRNAVNQGVAATVDFAIGAARYDWIVEADADDIQEKNRLAVTAETINRYPAAQMLAFSATNMDEYGNLYGGLSYCSASYTEAPEEMFLDSPERRVQNYTWQDSHKMGAFGSCMAFRRSVRERWGNLVTGESRIAQDPPLELRCLLSGPVLGSKKLVCRYRSHSSNLLNRTRRWDTLAAWVEHEKFHSRYHLFSRDTYCSMLRDICRARQTPNLTDWNASQLDQVINMLKTACYTSEMASLWWEMNSFRRVFWYLRHRKEVLPNMRAWFRNRILPFTLFCHLRFWKHRKGAV